MRGFAFASAARSRKTFSIWAKGSGGVFYSETKRVMSQRIRRFRDWAGKHLSGVVLEKVLDLCNKKSEWSLWYDERCEDAYTTSNMLDRLMRSQNGYFDRGQHFHGDLKSANLRSRAWARMQHYCAQLLALVSGVGCRKRWGELSGRAFERQALQRLLADEPIRRRFPRRLAGTKKSPPKIRKD